MDVNRAAKLVRHAGAAISREIICSLEIQVWRFKIGV